MGKLIVAVLVAALAWMGFWLVAATMLERGIRAYLAEDQPGIEIAARDVDVAGFPNRLDTTLTDLAVTLPETGTAWTAPFAQLLALVYRPTELIAVLPPEHRIETALQEIDLSHDRARASVALQATDDLALDRATLVVDAGRARSTLGWDVSLREARLSVEETETAIYRLGAEGLDIALGALSGDLPRTLPRVHLDAVAAFDRAWDRSAIEAERLPQVTGIDLADLSVAWGDMSFLASGRVEVDDTGRPEGTLDLEVGNWQEAFERLTAAGILPDAGGMALRFALIALSDGDRLTLPLAFRDGMTTLGPIPIGPAPDLTIR